MEASRTGTGRSHGRLWRIGSQTAPGTPRGNAGDERPREVGQLRSTGEAAEQSRGTGRGGGGGKGAGQGKSARAKRVPDSGPDRRAKRARAGTSGSSERKAAAVHGAPAPRLRQRPSAARVLRPEARRRGRSRRRDVAALRGETGREPPGPLGTAGAGSVSGEAGLETLHPEGGRAAAAARSSRAGRQDHPARRRRGPERDLRGRLPCLLLVQRC